MELTLETLLTNIEFINAKTVRESAEALKPATPEFLEELFIKRQMELQADGWSVNQCENQETLYTNHINNVVNEYFFNLYQKLINLTTLNAVEDDHLQRVLKQWEELPTVNTYDSTLIKNVGQLLEFVKKEAAWFKYQRDIDADPKLKGTLPKPSSPSNKARHESYAGNLSFKEAYSTWQNECVRISQAKQEIVDAAKLETDDLIEEARKLERKAAEIRDEVRSKKRELTAMLNRDYKKPPAPIRSDFV